jgi:5'-deoxynucleotidase YfbR-like HD superfamily hydrolase
MELHPCSENVKLFMVRYLLALLYLPEWDGDGPEYRKDDVLKTLLIHDIAEAEVGDTAYPNVTEETRASERRIMQYLQMCGTYLRVADMSETFALWNEFDSGLTQTAKIAADIDKLENLVQLYLYERDEPVEGAAAWKQWVGDRLQTKQGQDILQIVKEKYEK